MIIANKETLRSPEKESYPLKIVVDLNVIIEGIFYHSEAVETIFELLVEDTCRLVYTKKIQEEFEVVARGLRIGKGWETKVMDRKDRYFVRELFRKGLKLKENNYSESIYLPTDDPADAKFVTTARKGNCACIISYDYDLLDLPEYEEFQDITVLTPEGFLKKFGFTS